MSNEPTAGGHVVVLAATVDHDLGEDGALDVARRWARLADVTPGMTAWDGDRLALRVSGMARDYPPLTPARVCEALHRAAREAGAAVQTWDSVEVLAPHVVEQRLARRAIPPTVDAATFAALAGISTSRLRHLAVQRRAGERADFPAELLPGHWLRTEAEHWARTRRTRPGPPPGSPAARTPRAGEVAP